MTIGQQIDIARRTEDVLATIAVSDGLRFGWGSVMHRMTVDTYLKQRGERLELQALARDLAVLHSFG